MKKNSIIFLSFFLMTLLAIAAFMVLRNGRLALEMSASEKFYIEIINQNNGSLVGSAETNSGKYNKTLPAGKYEVRIANASGQGRNYYVNVDNFLKTTIQKVETVNQVSRTKLGRATESCSYAVGSELYSKACFSESTLYFHSPTTNTTFGTRTNVKIDGNILDIATYQDKLLVLHTDSANLEKIKPMLSLVKNGQVILSKTLPEDFDSSPTTTYEYAIKTDRKLADNFIIASRQDNWKVAHFSSFESTPKIVNPKVAVEGGNTNIDLFNGKLLISDGDFDKTSDVSDDGDVKSIDQTIRLFSKLDSNVDADSTFKLKGGYERSAFCGDGYICVLSNEKLSIYEPSGAELTEKYGLMEVLGFENFGASAVVIKQNDKLFSLNPANNYTDLIYDSKGFRVSNIQAASDGIIISAFSNNEENDSTLHAFKLGTSPASSNTFSDDQLLISTDDLSPDIVKMDYTGKTILISLLLDSSRYNRTTYVITYDQNEYQNVTQDIIKKLSEKGIKSPEYSINFKVEY